MRDETLVGIHVGSDSKINVSGHEERLDWKSRRREKQNFFKPADKGGAVVVWRTDLYIAVADHQLSDLSSSLPLEHDPTLAHPAIVSTMDGLRDLRFFLEKRPEPSPPTTNLLPLIDLVLTLNNFSFNSSQFFQHHCRQGLNQVRPISRMSALTPFLPTRNSDRVPLVLTYHPTSIRIQKIIRHHFHHLQQDATTRH
eukprot:g27528.t1